MVPPAAIAAPVAATDHAAPPFLGDLDTGVELVPAETLPRVSEAEVGEALAEGGAGLNGHGGGGSVVGARQGAAAGGLGEAPDGCPWPDGGRLEGAGGSQGCARGCHGFLFCERWATAGMGSEDGLSFGEEDGLLASARWNGRCLI